MTTQEIIEQILLKNPEINREQILEKLQVEKSKTGGLLCDETLLRLIAAKFGIDVQQKEISNDRNLSTAHMFAGLNDVSVAGRLVAVYPVRTFEGEKSGKFTSLVIVDNDGILRVVLWNEKTELVEKGMLKVGQNVCLSHGYTRADRYGKVELHLGGKGQIEIEARRKVSEYPAFDKFATKIGNLSKTSGTAHLSGKVKAVLGSATFTRNDSSDGTVMRLTLADKSGEVTTVVWNEKAKELEKTLKADVHLQLINAKVKETQNGNLEVHVDSNTHVNVQDS
jgi:ssDNA-binding replication factor A large subunit